MDLSGEPTAVSAVGEDVVTLQENNHLVIVDATSGEIRHHFSSGMVDLAQIDTEQDGALTYTDEQKDVLREPDAAQWLDDERFMIANEGDYNGGARGFSISLRRQ